MAGHQVFCVKLQKELPGLDEPPFDTDLGQKIYQNVSQQAWNQWMEFCKMLLNEYRLNPGLRRTTVRLKQAQNLNRIPVENRKSFRPTPKKCVCMESSCTRAATPLMSL